jgi:hypothetical protein
MDAAKRKALEAAGWRFGDAADFLGMTDEERQLLDARVDEAILPAIDIRIELRDTES